MGKMRDKKKHKREAEEGPRFVKEAPHCPTSLSTVCHLLFSSPAPHSS